MYRYLSQSDIAQFTPINALPAPRLTLLSGKAQMEELQPGDKLLASEQSRWYIYVLEGILKVSSSGMSDMVSAGSLRAHSPVFTCEQPADFAVTQSTCRIIRFERQLFDTLLTEERLSSYDVADVQVSDSELEVFQQIFNACNEGVLDLPAMPKVATRLMQLAQDPEAGIPELSKVIQMDPGVAGTIIQAVNSPVYRGHELINDITQAVVRLGLKITRNLACAIAMRQTYAAKSPRVKQHMLKLWAHSVNVSALSFVIARHSPGFDPERALLAGLLHDVGAVAVLNYVEENKLEVNPAELEVCIDKLRAIVCVLVIDFWGLDREFATVIEQCEDWLRDPSPTLDYCDIILLAHLFGDIDCPRAETLLAVDQLPAYKKSNLGPLDSHKNVQILTDAEAELAAIRQLLNG